MKKNKILKIILYIFFMFLWMDISAQTRGFYNIDTPTAFTAERGNYDISFLAYDKGSMEFKAFVGLASFAHLGVSFDVQSAIGKDRMRPNIPGVIGKIKFTDGWDNWPISVAVGYDSFFVPWHNLYAVEHNSHNRSILGPYLAITKPIYLFDDEQYITWGIHTPVQPDYLPKDTSYFMGIDFPLQSAFRLKGEIERVFWNFKKREEWLYGVGIRYTYMNQLSIEFDFMFKEHEKCNRIIRIEYYDHL
ncbi:MAG: hypothetical protein FWG92_05110 [Leptospirales bacterium]|nr:hypothetical protein [Leptospirales bacterium]